MLLLTGSAAQHSACTPKQARCLLMLWLTLGGQQVLGLVALIKDQQAALHSEWKGGRDRCSTAVWSRQRCACCKRTARTRRLGRGSLAGTPAARISGEHSQAYLLGGAQPVEDLFEPRALFYPARGGNGTESLAQLAL